jgi:hypothetical protein
VLTPADGFVPKVEIVQDGENLNLNNVSVYPNPVSSREMLNVELEGAIQERFNLAVYDITGKVIFQKQYNQQEKILVDVSSFSLGVYILTIRNGNFNFSQKFVVMN